MFAALVEVCNGPERLRYYFESVSLEGLADQIIERFHLKEMARDLCSGEAAAFLQKQREKQMTADDISGLRIVFPRGSMRCIGCSERKTDSAALRERCRVR